jgi:hypothetical protein
MYFSNKNSMKPLIHIKYVKGNYSPLPSKFQDNLALGFQAARFKQHAIDRSVWGLIE